MATNLTNMKLVISIIKFLKLQSEKEYFTPDTRESLEVAVQCLQTAYDIDSNDARLTKKDTLSLEAIFNSAVVSLEEIDNQLPEEIPRAILMKNIGNDLMENNKFSEAVRYYTAAIEVDNQKAIYYGNRAAAYSKLNDFKSAIKDCEMAIKIDPKYAKAYGRMGLAYTSLDQFDKAVKAFNKALELDPDNQSYQINLKALEKKDKSPSAAQGISGLNIDWGNIFSNPAFRNMASTLMQDQNIINVLTGLSPPHQPPLDGSGDSEASGSNPSVPNDRSLDMLFETLTAGLSPPQPQRDASGESEASGHSEASGSDDRRMNMLIEASNYLLARMRANPENVEQLRQAATRNPNPPNPDNRDPQ